MKIKLKLIALLLAAMSSFTMNSQIISKESVLKQVSQTSKLIFEGKVSSEGKSFRATNNAIYTSYEVIIDKEVFGNKASKITLVVEGGQIEENGMKVGTGNPHGVQLKLNVNSTIFCLPFADGGTNSFILVDQVVFDSNNSVVPSIGISEYYTNINDLYNDLSKELNIKIAQKKSLDVSESINLEVFDPTPYADKLNNYNNHIAFFTTKQNNAVPSNNANKVLANDLTLSTGNEQITVTSGIRYLEFDVFAKANTSGLYFDNCLLRLQYNTAAFGSNMMASGNATISKGTLFNSATYINPQTNSIDQTSNTLGIPFGIDYTQSTFNRTILTTSNKVLLHIKLKIQTCGQTSDLQFVDVSTTSNLSFFTTTANASAVAGTGFDNTTYVSPSTNVLCTVIVDDFNSPISGGVGSVLTITGSNFGATRGNGKVRFRNANAPNFPFLAGLDNSDYVSWSDSQIKIKLPSSTVLNGQYNNPGSGAFIVKNDLGDSTVAFFNSAFNPLTVHYSIDANLITTTTMGKLNLKNANGLGGYTIRLDTSISNYPDRKGCVIKAIRDWRCMSAVNLVLGTDLNAIPPAQDGITTISFAPGLSATQVAATFVQYQTCPSASINAITDFDTQVSRTYNFFFDTTGRALPVGLYDFYEVMVHEIGHGLGLDHVIDTTQIMHRSTKAPVGDSLLGNLRKKLMIYSGDADGALWQVTSSPTNVHGQCSSFNSHTSVNSSCSQVGIYENLKNLYDFIVYPNPTNGDILNLRFTNGDKEKAKVVIYDVTGRVVHSTDISAVENDTNTYSLNLNNFSSGMYFVNLVIDGYSFSQKIVKN